MSSELNDATTLAIDKVLILYILDSINTDIKETALFKITSSITDMNYFIFKQTLADLIESKLVGTYTKEEQVIKITSEGKTAYNLTKDVLPGILKLKIDSKLKEEFTSTQNDSSIIAEYTPQNENSFIVTCKIIENNEAIFEVKTYVGSRDRAKKIVDNWNEKANLIYPKMLNLLLNED